MKYRIQNNVSWQTVDGNCYLIDEKDGELFVLNEIAHVVWDGIANRKSVKNIVRDIAEGYQADRYMIESDIDELIQEFKEQGFITDIRG